MTRVGTRSIFLNLNVPAKQIFFLYEPLWKENFILWGNDSKKQFKLYSRIQTRIQGKLLRSRKRKIITLFRDPYARNVSRLFKSFNSMLYHDKNGVSNRFSSSYEILQYFYLNNVRKEIPFIWFKEEFQVTTGINVFDYDFDKDKGFMIIKKGRLEVLLLTLEKLDKNEKVIKEFTGDLNFELIHHNDGSQKWYSDLYSQFKKRRKLTQEEISFYYDNDVVRHFYTDEQIQTFINKWTSNG
jgi:hypothetical protein